MTRAIRARWPASALVLCAVSLHAPTASAYSVLAHEANVDAEWDGSIRPLLMHRFPRSSPADLARARAYAYGGSVIQDLGYYPFGSHFFSNLTHYVRSGDFVEALVRDARTVEDLGFALGALSHYIADTTGHPLAVNRSVPLMFPKLRAKYGDEVTYAESPSTHVLVEFSFDVLQVAAGRYLPEAYHSFVGFEVAKPVLAKAFRDTYGLELSEVFGDVDLAIGTYRRAVSEIVPRITDIAWRDKQDEIRRLTPGIERQAFVFQLSRRQYEDRFGTGYHRPGLLARFAVFVYKVVPKIGPLRPLKFAAPTPEAEALFLDSFTRTRQRYRAALDALGAGRLDLANSDFDTGQRARHGEYSLADDTYAELLDRFADRRFDGLSGALRADLTRFYGRPDGLTGATDRHARKQLAKVRRQLADLTRLTAPPAKPGAGRNPGRLR